MKTKFVAVFSPAASDHPARSPAASVGNCECARRPDDRGQRRNHGDAYLRLRDQSGTEFHARCGVRGRTFDHRSQLGQRHPREYHSRGSQQDGWLFSDRSAVRLRRNADACRGRRHDHGPSQRHHDRHLHHLFHGCWSLQHDPDNPVGQRHLHVWNFGDRDHGVPHACGKRLGLFNRGVSAVWSERGSDIHLRVHRHDRARDRLRRGHHLPHGWHCQVPSEHDGRI